MVKSSCCSIVVAAVVATAVAGCTCGNDSGAKSVAQPAAPSAGGTAAAGESKAAGSAAESPGTAGMKAYVDPATGKLTDRPAPGTPPLPGDVMVPHGTPRDSSVPGGGRLIGPEGEDPR